MKTAVAFLLSALILASCDMPILCLGVKDCSPVVSDEPFPISGRSLQESRKIQVYDHLNPDDLPHDPAGIEGGSLKGHTLTLKVASSGGCRTHVWGLAGSPAIAKSLPPQNNLFLTHNANGDLCEAMLYETLTFDLEPLAAVLKPSKEVILHVFEPGATKPFAKSFTFNP
ncbi:MAG: hypothetical protein JNN12_02215 [Bacteroidetes Order II. Incertae sedis bacterium]|nr:hypothetical protein [Bacteroidetes Order II. bacterium]